MIKKMLIALRTSIKLITLVSVAVLLVLGVVSLVYRPTYCVTLNGQELGYTSNKSALQKKINEYIENGDGQNVGFVQIDTLPEYKLCLVKKDIVSSDDEILEAVKSTGIEYHKYYAVLKDNEEKYYVATEAEADDAVNKLKEKQGSNVQNFGIVEKYEEELKEFTAVDTIVANLYVAPVSVAKTSKSSGESSTKEVVDKKIDFGYALFRPTSAGTLTSRYGVRWSKQHAGIDIGAPIGTEIYAAADGTVKSASFSNGGYGNLLIIKHANGVETYYAHCSKLLVSAGQQVTKGQVVAKVGNTGRSTGPHLHFEVRINGVISNPLNYVSY